MNILILQGPNLNLLGHKASNNKSRLTLDKLNREIKKFSRTNNVQVKIFQTHKIYMTISFLQRNRNTASGILIAPMAWAKYEYSLLETLDLIQLPVVQVLLDNVLDEHQSILSPVSVGTVHNDDPLSAFKTGLKTIIKHLS